MFDLSCDQLHLDFHARVPRSFSIYSKIIYLLHLHFSLQIEQQLHIAHVHAAQRLFFLQGLAETSSVGDTKGFLDVQALQ